MMKKVSDGVPSGWQVPGCVAVRIGIPAVATYAQSYSGSPAGIPGGTIRHLCRYAYIAAGRRRRWRQRRGVCNFYDDWGGRGIGWLLDNTKCIGRVKDDRGFDCANCRKDCGWDHIGGIDRRLDAAAQTGLVPDRCKPVSHPAGVIHPEQRFKRIIGVGWHMANQPAGQ